jgi:hypothetical protein
MPGSAAREVDAQRTGVRAGRKDSRLHRLVAAGPEGSEIVDAFRASVSMAERAGNRIVRLVIEEIVAKVTSPPPTELAIHWKGGCHTQLFVARNQMGCHRRLYRS